MTILLLLHLTSLLFLSGSVLNRGKKPSNDTSKLQCRYQEPFTNSPRFSGQTYKQGSMTDKRDNRYLEAIWDLTKQNNRASIPPYGPFVPIDLIHNPNRSQDTTNRNICRFCDYSRLYNDSMTDIDFSKTRKYL